MKKAFSLIELSIVILIIGILVAGVTASSRLVFQMKLAASRSLTAGSPVSTISGLMMWFETTLERSLDENLANTDQIAAWNDINPQSTYKYTLSQSNATYRPTYVKSGIGGIPSINFSSDHFQLDNITLPLNYSIFIVLRKSSAPNVNGMDIISMSNSNNFGLLFEIQPNSGAYLGYNRRFRALHRLPGTSTENDNYTTATNLIQDNNDYIVSFSRNYNSVSNIYLNGTIASDSANSLATVNQFGEVRFSLLIGNLLPGNLQRPFDGMISEIIFFDRALKNDEITHINKYLAKKYSIKI